MHKALVVFGTTTGNTEILAEYIADGMEMAGMNVELKNCTQISPRELKNFDLVALGCSTWGEGDMQDDFIAFFDQMEGLSLAGTSAFAFGPGDSSYDVNFCKAVDMIDKRLRECGANLIAPPLKIDGDIELSEDRARDWGKQSAQALTL